LSHFDQSKINKLQPEAQEFLPGLTSVDVRVNIAQYNVANYPTTVLVIVV